MDLFRNMVWSKRFQSAIWMIKLGLLSVGIISTLLLLKLTIPYSFNLVVSALPRLWTSLRSWLTPPYLYILVNFIIIGIAVSSSYQQKLSENKSVKEDEEECESGAKEQKQSEDLSSSFPVDIWPVNNENVSDSVDKPATVVAAEEDMWFSSMIESQQSTTPPPLPLPVKTSRFAGAGKKSAKTYRRSVSSAVVQAKNLPDTMDTTWKAITEGKTKPVTRHLKKSDTWDVTPHVVEREPETGLALQRELRKSDTFNDAASTTSSSGSSTSSRGGGLMRELSLSHEELNRRVEAFINKFNNDIRLQRQESHDRYLEMVNRGVY